MNQEWNETQDINNMQNSENIQNTCNIQNTDNTQKTDHMNATRSGLLYLIMMIVFIGFNLLIQKFEIILPLTLNMFLSEALLWIPTLIFLLINKTNPIKFCKFKKIHISSALMTVLFAFLIMPAATLMNVISMFFVENTVSMMSGEMMLAGFPVMFLMVAMHAPFAEEFMFRGAIYGGFTKSASVFKSIIVTSLLFGLTHLNINQAGYAIVLGIAMALLVEATGSIWPAFICHMVVNGRSVIALFGIDRLMDSFSGILGTEEFETMTETVSTGITTEQLWMMLCLEIFLVVICVPIGLCVLAFIAKKEGRTENLKTIWRDRKSGKIFSVPLILGILISAGFIVYTML